MLFYFLIIYLLILMLNFFIFSKMFKKRGKDMEINIMMFPEEFLLGYDHTFLIF